MHCQLPFTIRRPSRYLGSELHAVRAPAPGDLRIGLAFPDLYEVGMSHLGLALLYHCVNQTPGLFAERVFMPDVDLEGILREKGIPLATLETRLPLNRLDLLGFSLAYELTYTNLLAILELGGIPLRSEQRTLRHPIVIAGGPCAYNPEPLGPFIDAFVIGEAEQCLLHVCRLVREWKQSGAPREELLRTLDRTDGLYVPSLFEWSSASSGKAHRLVSLAGRTRPVRKQEVMDLDAAPYPEAPLVPLARIVHDRISVEAARGCPHACRFCQAGTLYRPYRERSPERLREIIRRALDATGYEEVSLLALSIGDYSSLGPLVSGLMDELEPRRVSLSLPSLRVGSLQAPVVEQILRVRKTGFTLAPEAATPRLRNVVNKQISEEELFRTTHLLGRLGWRSLKLYFMIGLPTEQEEDVAEIARFARKIRKVARGARGAPFQVTVNVSTFVPKPHTPFQWTGQQATAVSEAKQRFLQRNLRSPGFRVKWHDPRLSLLEGLFARGDRRQADLLEAAYRLGCRRDGWTEHLRFDLWERAFELTGIDPESSLDPFPDPDAPLPWDWIDTGTPRRWFLREHQKALRGESTEFLCSGSCDACGLCTRPEGTHRARLPEPLVLEPAKHTTRGLRSPVVRRRTEPGAVRFRVRYAKRPPATYLSHLETLTAFYRALRRSQLPILFTAGEHPHPRAAFSPALPVGVESEAEYIDLWLRTALDGSELLERLNQVLPEGFSVLEASQIPRNASSLEQSIVWVEYGISFQEAPEAARTAWRRALEAFLEGGSPAGAAPPDRVEASLRRAVKLIQADSEDGLVFRVHRVSGTLPSPMRLLKVLSPAEGGPEVKARIQKRQAAVVSSVPVGPRPKRMTRHDQ